MKRKTFLLIAAGLFLVLALIIGGRIDYNDSHPTSVPVQDSVLEYNDFAVGVSILSDDTLTVDQLYVMVKKIAEMSKHQRSELIYNTDREVWDTVYVSQLYATYKMNPEFYDSLND